MIRFQSNNQYYKHWIAYKILSVWRSLINWLQQLFTSMYQMTSKSNAFWSQWVLCNQQTFPFSLWLIQVVMRPTQHRPIIVIYPICESTIFISCFYWFHSFCISSILNLSWLYYCFHLFCFVLLHFFLFSFFLLFQKRTIFFLSLKFEVLFLSW